MLPLHPCRKLPTPHFCTAFNSEGAQALFSGSSPAALDGDQDGGWGQPRIRNPDEAWYTVVGGTEPGNFVVSIVMLPGRGQPRATPAGAEVPSPGLGRRSTMRNAASLWEGACALGPCCRGEPRKGLRLVHLCLAPSSAYDSLTEDSRLGGQACTGALTEGSFGTAVNAESAWPGCHLSGLGRQ